VQTPEENVSDSLMFVLPDGRSAAIPARSARLICDRLWEFGITPGASLAAARISEVLERHPRHWRDIAFSEREVSPLLEAAEVAPPSWSLARAGPPFDLEEDVRAHLLATCDTLIENHNAGDHKTELRGLVADIERLRDHLSS
jgi:hypothetical protein